jgi:hypothetical protein
MGAPTQGNPHSRELLLKGAPHKGATIKGPLLKGAPTQEAPTKSPHSCFGDLLEVDICADALFEW